MKSIYFIAVVFGTAAAPLFAAPPAHWAFRPVTRPALPANGIANPVDAFVRAKLAEKALAPSPEADRRTLIRRLTFDLHGLPPTPAEVRAFIDDQAPGATAKLVDRLLASPRYGERWARHWLDVARYADNKGYVFFEDKQFPWAWTYRDYVVAAFNDDLPYDQFVKEQIAADLLPNTPSKHLAALGYLTVGNRHLGNVHDIIDDRIDVVTRGLMGFTVACARCHDHKFDPIPTADYYSLYGVFRSSSEPTVPPLWEAAPKTPAYDKFAAELAKLEQSLTDYVQSKHRELVAQARGRAADYLNAAALAWDQPPVDDFMLITDVGDLNPAMTSRYITFLARAKKVNDPVWALWHRYRDAAAGKFDAVRPLPADEPRVQAAFQIAPKNMQEVSQRYGQLLKDAEQKRQAAKEPAASNDALLALLYGPDSAAEAPLALDWGFLSLFPERATQAEYQKRIKAIENHLRQGPPRSMVLADAAKPADAHVFLRGQANRPGEEVPRQFLRALDPARKPFQKGSGRLELAEAVASLMNPLTARVMVNRVWMHHFGVGLVATPGDFGVRGAAPSHPELLDWLAAEFMAKGWSVKHLHQLILNSAAYQQQSVDRPQGQKLDPENQLLWKQNRKRLEFEALHDAMLATAGVLQPQMGGPTVPILSGHHRRALYGYIDRLEFPSLLTTFDVPEPATSCPERSKTIVAPQALFLMNSPFSRDAARRLASRPEIAGAKTPAEQLDAMFRTALGRPPSMTERTRSLQYVNQPTPGERWADVAQTLLMTNEFCYID